MKIDFYSKAFEKNFSVDRVIGRYSSGLEGPSLIFTAGIHGNEPSGIIALESVFKKLDQLQLQLKGDIIGLTGNMNAIQRSQRFMEYDLNRLWTKDRVKGVLNNQLNGHPEHYEMKELLSIIRPIIKNKRKDIYFFDLHSTSAETPPFITINDMVNNRELSKKYPVPVILGLEEYLDGPLLSFINEVGYTCLGFEAGQHDSMHAIEHHKEFIYLSMFFTGMLDSEDQINFNKYYNSLAQTSAATQRFFEISTIHKITPEDKFKMRPGYVNFQKLRKGDIIAEDINDVIEAHENSRIFMPLYQPQGEDGFFLINQIKEIWLDLSVHFRNWQLDRILILLPGISRSENDKKTLIANKSIARFLVRDFMHLLGYRVKQEINSKIHFTKRDHTLDLSLLNI